MKLSIVIPIFNEIDFIAKVIQRVQEVDLAGIDKELILVDDASTDGTRDLLLSMAGGNLRDYPMPPADIPLIPILRDWL